MLDLPITILKIPNRKVVEIWAVRKRGATILKRKHLGSMKVPHGAVRCSLHSELLL